MLFFPAFLIAYLIPRLLGGGRRPFLAGLTIFAAFALPLAAEYATGGLLSRRLPVMLAGSALVLVLGGVNDRWPMRKWLKLLCLVAISGWAAHQGLRIESVKLPFSASIFALGQWAVPASVIWLAGLTYLISLSQGLPGFICGAVGVASLTFAALGLLQGTAVNAAVTIPMALALAGAALGYLPHDFPPARLRLDSAGHLALGFAVASISIIGALKNTAFLVVALPLLVFGLPLLDTTYAVIRRSREGRPVLSLARRREFLHEALIRGGMSVRTCVALFYLVTAYLCLVALALVGMIEITFLLKLGVLAVLLGIGLLIFYSAALIASRAAPAPGLAGRAVEIFHVPVTVTDAKGALDRIERFIKQHSPHMVVTSDASAIVKAQRDKELQEIISRADLVTPDGTGVVWAARILGLPLWERVAGVDLVERISQRAARRGWSIYLLGSEPGVAEQAALKLQERYPGLKVAGVMHGYFTPQEEPEVVARIAAARPEVLFVAFGIPKQEKWISRYLHQLGVPVAIGVGGSFDVISGRLKRAPRWVQAAGLEWLYRAVRQPSRLPRLWALPRFVVMALAERFLWRKPARGQR